MGAEDPSAMNIHAWSFNCSSCKIRMTKHCNGSDSHDTRIFCEMPLIVPTNIDRHGFHTRELLLAILNYVRDPHVHPHWSPGNRVLAIAQVMIQSKWKTDASMEVAVTVDTTSAEKGLLKMNPVPTIRTLGHMFPWQHVLCPYVTCGAVFVWKGSAQRTLPNKERFMSVAFVGPTAAIGHNTRPT